MVHWVNFQCTRDQSITVNCNKFPAVLGEKVQNWFQRQFPDEMSQGCDPQESEYAAAVAAAAFSIYLVEEAEAQNRRKMRKELEMSRAKLKSRKEDSITRRTSSNDHKDRGNCKNLI